MTNHILSATSLGWDNGMHTGTVRRQAGPQERIFLMLPLPMNALLPYLGLSIRYYFLEEEKEIRLSTPAPCIPTSAPLKY